MSSQAEVCDKGHNDWVITDPIKGWRRCRTCHRLSNRRAKRAPAWGVEANGKPKRAGRGSESYEDTWSYTELMKIRGYVV